MNLLIYEQQRFMSERLLTFAFKEIRLRLESKTIQVIQMTTSITPRQYSQHSIMI